LSRLSSRQEARTHPKFVDGASVMSVKAELGWPMMLGAATAAKVRLIVWCKSCGHQVEPDSAEMAARYSAGTSVLDWRTSWRAPASGSP
jgi:hypothetical protein